MTMDDTNRVLMRARMETLGAQMPTIIFDRDRLTDAGADEINQIRALYREDMIMIMPLPCERMHDMFVFAPPDQLARYEAGYPLVIAPVPREEHTKSPKHRPADAQVVKDAKRALEVEAFRLVGRQKATELAGSDRRLDLTPAEAEDRAKLVIADAIWRGDKRADDDEKRSRLEGLVDRGRRLARKFFGIRRPIDRWRIEGRDVQKRVNDEGRAVLPLMAADNRDRAKGMAWNEARARDFNRAMSAWNTTVRVNERISLADGMQVTNGLASRMSAPALMKVAISGDFDPSRAHKNFLLEQRRFAVGLLFGQLNRGCTINLTDEQAAILERAIGTVRRQRCETHADGCDWLLVEAALKCHPLEFWEAVLGRLRASGASETINPKNRSEGEKK